ncbi:aromatic acid exporter family protein [Acinetobacter rathckeae]|uniref:FUSC family protein n=1 Tax=Acinetobacter rathckeae TaxID=2605272 RepID=UPI0018A2C2E6|nr:FUSC family protein [Acinetobacter rathckeae]MBF7689086.1 FUSC family protein [Acinetobacter rathckeae]MBF7696652.1 FUSC family protein [Acinetobacter rathckeae]
MTPIALDKFAKIVYVIKILLCAITITVLSICFNQNQVSHLFLWGSLTAFFSIQADIKLKVNFNQVTGNLIGSSIGVGTWLLVSHFSKQQSYINIEYWLLILGIVLTTTTCILLKHAEYCGIALSGLLIVTVYDVTHNTFEGALWRILFCVVGCIVAYTIDAFVRYFIPYFKNRLYK